MKKFWFFVLFFTFFSFVGNSIGEFFSSEPNYAASARDTWFTVWGGLLFYYFHKILVLGGNALGRE